MYQVNDDIPLGCVYEKDGNTKYCPMLNREDVPFCQYFEDEPEAAIGIDERPVYCPISDVPEPCENAISRQAAIDALNNLQKFNLIDSNEYLHGVGVRLKFAVQTLEQLPSAQPEQQWIPCSERLPKEEKRHYWVCTDTGYQCQCRWTNDVYGLGVSDRWNWKIFDIPQYQKVVAWMPLPKPWNGDHENIR